MAERVIEKEPLRRWLAEGLNRKQIVEKIHESTGHQVSPSAISNAMKKWGFAPLRERHDELIPWVVKTQHLELTMATLLRKIARRRKGLPNPPRIEVWVDGWLDRLAEADVVIGYVPDALHEEDVFPFFQRLDSDGPPLSEDPEHGAIIRHPQTRK